MEYLVNSGEMKKCDSITIQKFGMPSMVLMERAALCTVEELTDGTFDLQRVLVICGSGNNGGDGFAVARLLQQKQVTVKVLFVGEESRCTIETAKQMEIAKNYGLEICKEIDISAYTTIVDALFGIGVSRDIEGEYARVIQQMNKAGARILSIDIPSGISADTGKLMGIAVQADKTVTFAYKKIGLILYPGAAYAGTIKVKDIGITDEGFEGQAPFVFTYTQEDLAKMPKRSPYSNKGTFGKVLVIAGSANMSGAAFFSGKAAYRMGAGLVRIYTPEENRQILQTMLPEAVLTTYEPAHIETEALKEAIQWASVIVIGPGMGKGDEVYLILEAALTYGKTPMVIDADGINMIAEYPKLLQNHRQDIILTPHLGEMARLIKKSISKITENFIEEAKKCAKEQNLICVLKDARTVVVNENGQIYLNQSGNSGMATGGSGDVLTGIIAGLLAQGMRSYEAATLGVYIHGLAGDRAAEAKGEYSMIAQDIIDHIQQVIFP